MQNYPKNQGGTPEFGTKLVKKWPKKILVQTLHGFYLKHEGHTTMPHGRLSSKNRKFIVKGLDRQPLW